MTKHRLFIVEGLPCSGKSETAKFVADCLRLKGNKVVCVDEGGGNHPADYEAHAFLNERAMTHFSDFERQQIRAVGFEQSGGLVVPLAEFSGYMVAKLTHFKVYDFLPWQTEKPVMLDKWRKFVKTANDKSTYVFNCVLMQNPMSETMMRFGFDAAESESHIRDICDIAAPLSPVVIYLQTNDIAPSVQNAVAQRGRGWLNGVVSYHVNGAYGKSINARGFDGYVACLTERQKRELDILPRLPVCALVVDNACADWSKSRGLIQNFIAENG